MKIDTSLKVAAPPQPRPSVKPAAPETGGEQVRLSSTSQVRGGEPPVDSSRVMEIKQAIMEGRFRINPEAIADRLIDTARELINAQRRG